MSGSLNLRSSTAAAAAIVVAGWGAFAAPAAAGPSHGNGNAASQGSANSAQGPQGEGAKGHQGNNGHGPKASNGKGPKGNNGKGPKGNNGHGPKAGKGPKGNNGNHGTAAAGADKGPQAGASADDTDTGSSAGGTGDPAGNNGTVKITPHLEDDGTPQNTPHVSCIFDIEWYGFDEGEDIWSTVEFAMQAPSTDVALSGTDPSQVFVGGDPASGAGTDSGFDGEATYSLVFDGEAHPQQGYHVKLTVHTPGSQGADTKHKVFWVEPCEDEAVVPETGTADSGTATETPTDTATAASDEAEESSVEESSDEDAALGESGTDDEVTTESDAEKAESGADTSETADDSAAMGTAAGSAEGGETDVPNSVDAGAGARVTDLVTSPWGLLVMALGLALGGAALVARRRTV